MENINASSNGNNVGVYSYVPSSSGTVNIDLAGPLDAPKFHEILRTMLSAGEKVSDLIFSPGRPPQVELTGDLQGVPISGYEALRPAQIKSIADLMLLNNAQGFETLEKKGSSDISYSANGIGR